MAITDIPGYLEDLNYIVHCSCIAWEQLANKSVLLSGGTGQIGSCLVDAILLKDEEENLGCQVTVITRNKEKAKERFQRWEKSPYLSYFEQDVNTLNLSSVCQWDYILHLASNTHPVAYATKPVETILTNIIGTDNLLKLAVASGARRFLLASSNEIYGENRGDSETFDESYSGYIDCNTLRAGYPESKRCAEALCQAYRKQYGLDTVIARLTRTFGPSLLPEDTKAMSQFLKNAVKEEDIILKSRGNQVYSYTYVADAVTGLLCILTKGTDGEAYNVAEPLFDRSLYQSAEIIARFCGKEVIFDVPQTEEAAGFSKVTKARLDNTKIKALGWKAQYDLEKSLVKTIVMLRQLYGKKEKGINSTN